MPIWTYDCTLLRFTGVWIHHLPLQQHSSNKMAQNNNRIVKQKIKTSTKLNRYDLNRNGLFLCFLRQNRGFITSNNNSSLTSDFNTHFEFIYNNFDNLLV
eukprot:GAHX01002343.1.p2 GENE.GAHX01002343.1~~GAHX01002343.1.p2  ORF type:complete len:100 (-),score=7.51 GAHX01002343.1:739-1038(-)